MRNYRIFKPEDIEAICVKWANGYSWTDLGKEYETDTTHIKRVIRRHILIIMAQIEHLEKANSELWEQRFKTPAKAGPKYDKVPLSATRARLDRTDSDGSS